MARDRITTHLALVLAENEGPSGPDWRPLGAYPVRLRIEDAADKHSNEAIKAVPRKSDVLPDIIQRRERGGVEAVLVDPNGDLSLIIVGAFEKDSDPVIVRGRCVID